MGQEIKINELMKAGSHAVNAGQQIAPNDPAVRILSEIKGIAMEAKSAILAGIELTKMKGSLKATQAKPASPTESVPEGRIATPKVPLIKADKFIELVLQISENIFQTNPEYKDKKVSEVLEAIKKEPFVAQGAVAQFYNTHYEKFLDLSQR